MKKRNLQTSLFSFKFLFNIFFYDWQILFAFMNVTLFFSRVFFPKLYFRINFFSPILLFSISLPYFFFYESIIYLPFFLSSLPSFSQFTISPRNFVFFHLSIFCFYNSTPKFILFYPFPSTSLSFSFIFLFTVFFIFIHIYIQSYPLLSSP